MQAEDPYRSNAMSKRIEEINHAVILLEREVESLKNAEKKSNPLLEHFDVRVGLSILATWLCFALWSFIQLSGIDEHTKYSLSYGTTVLSLMIWAGLKFL